MSNSVIKQFSQKVTLASNKGSKDIVLPVAEVVKLLDAIVSIQSDNLEAKNEIIRLLKQLSEPQIIQIDGGSY